MATVGSPVVEYDLTPADVSAVRAVARELTALAWDPADPGSYEAGPVGPELLPAGLGVALRTFQQSPGAAACLIHGFPVDDELAGPTPAHWLECPGPEPTFEQDVFMALCASALGEVVSWATLQAGRMVQSILPIRGDEHRQSGHGSEALLEFHTEDGFHPARCDYLLLFGMRNNEAVPTLLAAVGEADLPEWARAVLAEPRFHLLPDDEHIRQLSAARRDHPGLARMLAMRDRPTPVAVLFNEATSPEVRFDRPFMRCIDDDPISERALDALLAALERVVRDVVVARGTLLVVNNHRAVHGRRPFRSRFDGTDRWLRRMLVTRDLRRAAEYAVPGSGRVLA